MDPDTIYGLIENLNKAQQEMKWTNHPRIFLEVMLIKLCQGRAVSAQSGDDLQELQNKVQKLESELQAIKTSGVSIKAEAPTTPAKTKQVNKKSYKVPVGKVHQILKNATKQDLQLVKSHWAELLSTLANQNMKSVAALLNDSEPVAASSTAFVVKFKYEIHCQMTMENSQYIDYVATIMERLVGRTLTMEGVPDQQWKEIREAFLSTQQPDESDNEPKKEDPIIAEARKLVGDELLEIKD